MEEFKNYPAFLSVCSTCSSSQNGSCCCDCSDDSCVADTTDAQEIIKRIANKTIIKNSNSNRMFRSPPDPQSRCYFDSLVWPPQFARVEFESEASQWFTVEYGCFLVVFLCYQVFATQVAIRLTAAVWPWNAVKAGTKRWSYDK